MKFTITADVLYPKMQNVSKVMASKNSLPILNKFLLSLSNGMLEMTASDADNSMVTSIAVDNAEGEGKIAIDAKMMLDGLKVLIGRGPITFDINTESQMVAYECGKLKAKIVGEDGGDYPEPKKIGEDCHSFRIQSAHMMSGLHHTLFCASTDTTKPSLMGVFLELTSDSKLAMVATDATKLAKMVVPVVEMKDECSIVMPAKACVMLKGLLPSEGEDVIVKFDDVNMCFEMNNYTLFVRQVEGRFPDYKRVVPKEWSKEVIVSKSDIIDAMSLLVPFSNPGAKVAILDFADNNIHFETTNDDQGSAEYDITCSKTGEDFLMGLECTYMKEICGVMDLDDIVMKVDSPNKGFLIEPVLTTEAEGVVKPEFFCLLMPMRVDSYYNRY